MAINYTTLLGLAQPVTGTESSTWGTAVNDQITGLLDTAVAGATTITVDADITLSDTTGAANEARQAIIIWATASGTTTRNITAPARSKGYVVINKAVGAQSIVLRGAGPTAGITIVQGEYALVAWNGSDFVKIANQNGTGNFTTLVATTGNITTVNATTVDTTNIEVTNLKAKDGTAAGSIADATGVVTLASSVLTTADINGGTVDGVVIGASSAAAATVTTLIATSDSSFTSAGAVTISKGNTAARPSPVSGMLRFNTTTTEFEGYNGTAWASVGGSAISNDTATATNLYPAFLNATTGTAANIYTGNAYLLYKPSTGEFQARVPVASNGIVVNSLTVATSYTIAAGYSGMSTGPVSISGGAVVTISSGSRWVVI
jgi:hypothetical protein